MLLGTVDVGGCTAANVGLVEFATFVPDPPPIAGCNPSGGGIEGEIDELGAWTSAAGSDSGGTGSPAFEPLNGHAPLA